MNKNVNGFSQSGSAGVLTAISGPLQGSTFPFQNSITIGRDPRQCNVVFPPKTPGVSRCHCKLEVRNDGVYIMDVGSSNGTFFQNGQRLPVNQWVKVTQNFCLGSPKIVFAANQIVRPMYPANTNDRTNGGNDRHGSDKKDFWMKVAGLMAVVVFAMSYFIFSPKKQTENTSAGKPSVTTTAPSENTEKQNQYVPLYANGANDFYKKITRIASDYKIQIDELEKEDKEDYTRYTFTFGDYGGCRIITEKNEIAVDELWIDVLYPESGGLNAEFTQSLMQGIKLTIGSLYICGVDKKIVTDCEDALIAAVKEKVPEMKKREKSDDTSGNVWCERIQRNIVVTIDMDKDGISFALTVASE